MMGQTSSEAFGASSEKERRGCVGWVENASFTDLAVKITHWKLVGMGAIRCGSILGVGSEMRCEVPALCWVFSSGSVTQESLKSAVGHQWHSIDITANCWYRIAVLKHEMKPTSKYISILKRPHFRHFPKDFFSIDLDVSKKIGVPPNHQF